MAQLIAAQTTSAIRPPSDQQPVQTGLGYLSEEPPLGSRITPLARPETAATNPELTMSYRKTQLTEKITPLDDGQAPTFRQWKASILDRLEVNSDHYPTRRSRLALV